MPKGVLGLDISGRSVKIAQLKSTLRGFEFLSCLNIPLDSSETEGVSAAIRTILSEHRLHGERVVSLLPARFITTRHLTLPFKDLKKIAQIIKYEMEPHIPFPLDEIVIDFLPIRRPSPQETEVMVVAVSKERIREHLEILAGAGLNPEIIEVDAFASLNLYTIAQQEKSEEVVALVDLGAEQTSVMIAKGGIPLFVRSFPEGSNDITRAIQEELEVDSREAERVKRDPSLGSHVKIAGIIQTALGNLLKNIDHTFMSYRNQSEENQPIGKIFLCGGGAHLNNISEYFTYALHIATTPLLSLGNISHPFRGEQTLMIADFSAAMGAALRGINRGNVKLDLRREEFSFQRVYEGIGKRLISVAVVGAIVLIAALSDFFYRLNMKEDRYQTLKGETRVIFQETFPEVKNLVDPPQQAKAAIKEIDSKLKTFGNVANPHLSALDIVREITASVPKDLKIDISDLLISKDSIRMTGETNSFDAVDTLKKAFEKSGLFGTVTITDAKAGANDNRVEFKISMTLAGS